MPQWFLLFVCFIPRWSRPRGTGVLPGWVQCGFHQGKYCRNNHTLHPPNPTQERFSWKHKTPPQRFMDVGKMRAHSSLEGSLLWCDPLSLNTIDQARGFTHSSTVCSMWTPHLCLTVQLYPPVQEAVILHRHGSRNPMCSPTHTQYMCYTPPSLAQALSCAHTHWPIHVIWLTLPNCIYSRKDGWW